MNAPLPFGLPGPTAFYLALYLLTLVVHVVFMNYVLAGSGVLAWALLRGRAQDPIVRLLRDWMPFALGAAITAGVAPLLFVQILYRQSFYTANLLLFNRWMALLPVLIVGFYLLYLQKAKAVGRWPAWSRTVVGVGAFLCFAFVAQAWTENHLLSLAGQTTWSDFYAERRALFLDPQLVPRLGVWFLGAFATLAWMLGWQVRRE
ncbi:MAG: hypothetical protein KDA22_09210, partial [Phycisphaerales bacterium]|nr:hypothetical protein [Phycisphaerales bacterium]